MSKWLDLTRSERLAILTAVEKAENLQQESAVEKDWWVTAVIKALFKTPCAASLSFKGGTSLSKGWGLIERFSEDIDLALDHSFFGIDRTNKKQRDNLCRKSRAYIIDTLANELDTNLKAMGIAGYRIEPVTERMTTDGPVHINSNTDPTVLLVHYETILDTVVEYIPPRVKIEISCMSLDEPTEMRNINSLIYNYFEKEDNETTCTVRTVVPTRTFLEKAFLLNEEFHKVHPRYHRMSRHLYDLEKLMDTKFAKEAISDKDLYDMIVEHRAVYYALPYFNYSLHSPETISLIPPESIIDKWREDYAEMQRHFIFGDSLSFDELISRIQILQDRFREIR